MDVITDVYTVPIVTYSVNVLNSIKTYHGLLRIISNQKIVLKGGKRPSNMGSSFCANSTLYLMKKLKGGKAYV